ncbi:hypothetical protein J7J18_04630 [bacterium]|nr:hypothetical protein [bacterium]
MEKRFSPVMLKKETKDQLSEIISVIKENYPWINSYNDVIVYLIWFWKKNAKID